jgi:hypothetical protein
MITTPTSSRGTDLLGHIQVADMNKIAARHREISENKEAVPGILSQAEAMAQTIAYQFKFCKLLDEH